MNLKKHDPIQPKPLEPISRRNPRIIPPEGGWKPQTWYLVEVAFSISNVIHGALFYTGFLNGRNGGPGGYNQFAGYEDREDINSVVYMKGLRAVITTKEIEQIETKVRTPAEFNENK